VEAADDFWAGMDLEDDFSCWTGMTTALEPEVDFAAAIYKMQKNNKH